VRDEDLDWEIYHALLDETVRSAADLAAAGHDPALVEASLRRLEKSLLIERRGDAVRPLSFKEAILLCQAKNDDACPFVVENGVIRPRKGSSDHERGSSDHETGSSDHETGSSDHETGSSGSGPTRSGRDR
jgi:hypothetical protein